ncbi:MAG: hypothetical protein PWQ67_1520 [Clostridia bacterium]|jgi:hypothetical protein|nr:hypothetical protein [Clostridia bacterium]MDN5323066.1 hypothetical protein [Clostridia bacterium]
MRLTDILILGIILGSYLFYLANKKFKTFKVKKTLATAKKAEKDAISFLNKEGYDIIDIQQKEPIVVYIDEKPYPSYVQADFIVKKGNKKYVVEVKTGKKARATTALVRRQLLEYYLVFNPHGILLLDMDKRTLKRIEFQWGKTSFSLKGILIAGLMGTICGLILWRFFG